VKKSRSHLFPLGAPVSKLALLVFGLLTALAPAQSETIAKAGELELKTQDIREALAGLEATQQTSLSKDPAAVAQYVRALLIQRLVLKQATEKKFDQDPAVIGKLVRARETALTEAYLESFSQPPAGYPSEEELAAAYESAKPSLLLPKSYRLAQIFVKDAAKLADVQKKLKAKDADFAAIAKAHSEEPASAAKGGEIGWLSEAQIQPSIKDKLPALKPGGPAAEAIQLDDGWHILKLLETREPATATLDQVRPSLTARLRADKAKELRQQYLTTLLKDHPVAINEIELSKLLNP
jgi:parvulin-like peptidyl-prolyl isomerase